MLNPQWLRTFQTLVDIGHFTRTAEILNITQPGVSQHIRKLEQACGYNLLNREGKHFELTDQGEKVYQYARQLELQESALLDDLSFDNPFAGQYRLACSGATALKLYPRLLDLQSEHRELTPQLEVAPNGRILEQVKNGDLDLGIVTQITTPELFDTELLGHEPICLILPAGTDPSADITDQLNQLGLINHPDALHYLSLYCAQSKTEQLKRLNIDSIPVSGYINQLSQILLPVSLGLGFTVLPKSAYDNFSASNKLRIYAPEDQITESLHIIKKRNRELPARFEIIIQTLRNHFAESEPTAS